MKENAARQEARNESSCAHYDLYQVCAAHVSVQNRDANVGHRRVEDTRATSQRQFGTLVAPCARSDEGLAGIRLNPPFYCLISRCFICLSFLEVGVHEPIAVNDLAARERDLLRKHRARIDAGVKLAALATRIDFGRQVS